MWVFWVNFVSLKSGGVSLTFHELSKIFSRNLYIAEIVLLMRISSWNFVLVQRFRLKLSLSMWFPALCIFAILFWTIRKTLVKQPPGSILVIIILFVKICLENRVILDGVITGSDWTTVLAQADENFSSECRCFQMPISFFHMVCTWLLSLQTPPLASWNPVRTVVTIAQTSRGFSFIETCSSAILPP